MFEPFGRVTGTLAAVAILVSQRSIGQLLLCSAPLNRRKTPSNPSIQSYLSVRTKTGYYLLKNLRNLCHGQAIPQVEAKSGWQPISKSWHVVDKTPFAEKALFSLKLVNYLVDCWWTTTKNVICRK